MSCSRTIDWKMFYMQQFYLMPILWFVISLFAFSSAQPYFKDPPQLEVGVVDFNAQSYHGTSITTVSNMQYFQHIVSHTYRNTGNATDSLSIGFFGIYVQKISQTMSLDLSVTAQYNWGFNITVASWSGQGFFSVRISYCSISSSFYSDMIYPYSITHTPSLPTYITAGTTYSFQVQITPIDVVTEAAMIKYISGFRILEVRSSFHEIRLTDSQINQATLEFTVQTDLSPHSYQLQQIRIGFLIVNTSSMLSTFQGQFVTVYRQCQIPDCDYIQTAVGLRNDTTFGGLSQLKVDQRLRFQIYVYQDEFELTRQRLKSVKVQVISFLITLCSRSSIGLFLLLAQQQCYGTCPNGYYDNFTSFLCEPCHSPCQTCLDSADQCLTCEDGTLLQGTQCINCSSNCETCVNQPEQCLTCHDGYYVNWINVCDPCITGCIQCQSNLACQNCSWPYILNSGFICVINCSQHFSGCSLCNYTGGIVVCSGCEQGYELKIGACEVDCGEGSIMGVEECDDNNTENGDGCSSTCQIEDFFTCEGVDNSVCELTSLSVSFQYSVKQPSSNTLSTSWQLTPAGLPIYSQQNWASSMSLSSDYQTHSHAVRATISSVTYDPSTGLKVNIGYVSSLPPNFYISINYSTLSSAFHSINSSVHLGSSSTSNNLSTSYFEDSVYSLANILSYVAMLIGVLTLLLFVVGIFGAKLVTLQVAKTVQLTALALVPLSDLTPTLESLRYLSISYGVFPQQDYDYSTNMNLKFRSARLNSNRILDLILPITILTLPFIAVLFWKILSCFLVQKRASLKKWWKYLLGEYSFYGLMFISYTAIANATVAVITGESSGYTYLAIGLTTFLLLLGQNVGMYRKAKWWGEFKQKIDMMSCLTHLYLFFTVERIINSLLVIVLIDFEYCLAIPAILQIIFLMAMVTSKPYLLGDFFRPILNHSLTLVCLGLLTVDCIMYKDTSYETFRVYSPLVIILCLLITILVAIYRTFKDIKEAYQLYKIKNQNDNNAKGQQDTPQKKADLQFSLLTKQLFNQNPVAEAFYNKITIHGNSLLKQWQAYDDPTQSALMRANFKLIENYHSRSNDSQI